MSGVEVVIVAAGLIRSCRLAGRVRLKSDVVKHFQRDRVVAETTSNKIIRNNTESEAKTFVQRLYMPRMYRPS